MLPLQVGSNIFIEKIYKTWSILLLKVTKRLNFLDKKIIGQKIKNRRKQLKMTQLELAVQVGLHEKHISRIEAGQNFPNLDSFFKIIEILDLKMSDFDPDCELSQGAVRDEINYILNNSTEKELKLYLDIIKRIVSDNTDSVFNN